MSNLNLEQVIEWLYEKDYLAGWMFTDRFHRDIKSTKYKPTIEWAPAPAVPGKLVLSAVKDWPMFFMEFIEKAKVPARIEASNGEVYSANKYSEPAMKVFRKALESNINYDILLKSVQLYYKSNIRLKKAIGNYFIQGDWRTGYTEMFNAIASGEKKLIDHIKTESDVTTGHTGFSLG